MNGKETGLVTRVTIYADNKEYQMHYRVRNKDGQEYAVYPLDTTFEAIEKLFKIEQEMSVITATKMSKERAKYLLGILKLGKPNDGKFVQALDTAVENLDKNIDICAKLNKKWAEAKTEYQKTKSSYCEGLMDAYDIALGLMEGV